jgi:hypothetical protein
MYTNVNEFAFMKAFKDMNRMDNFSSEGLRALFEFFEQIEDDTSEPMELGVIAICCYFSEKPLEDVLENYSLESLDELREQTLVIKEPEEYGPNGSDTVVYQNF